MPRTFGDGVVHSSHFDAMVYTEQPIYEKSKTSLDPVTQRIGQLIAENLVENGATLQMGVRSSKDI